MPTLPSRQALRGYVLWAFLLVAVGTGAYLFHRSRRAASDSPLSSDEAAKLDSFRRAVAADSLASREAWESRFRHHAWQGGGYASCHGKYVPRAVETFPFNPNRCDSLTFLRLGLKPWQAHNALQYRRKGGVWRSAEHFSKLYGLSKEDYRRLAPYVRIDSAEARHHLPAQAASPRPYPEKYAPGSVVINLNGCDTTELRRIPDIGSYRAAQIVRYREQLGGFVSLSQLREIQSLPAGIEAWFTLESSPDVQRINVNTATFQQLVRHPYLNYEQTRQIINFRRQNGRLSGWDDLRLSPYFTAADFQRLRPYFEF